MNRAELIEGMVEKSGLTKKDAGAALDAALATVTETMANGDTVSLIGFGTFSVKDRAARKGRNPATGAEIDIKASKAPAFKPGKGLKDACN